MKKKICVVTGTRAEYGLLENLIRKLKNDKDINLKILVTGMHLSKDFGNTYKEIVKDGFKIEKKINILNSSDSPQAISRSTGKGIIYFASIFKSMKPDLLVVLGDRYEIFSSVVAANFQRIPVAHISGGELTLGALDDVLRHSISKMSWYHFVSTPSNKKRVIQLGEDPKRIFVTGSLGVDRLKNTKLQNKKIIEKKLNFKFNKKNLLIAYHPVTLENNTSAIQFKQILSAVSALKDTKLIFTYPNSDTNGRIVIKMIKKFVSSRANDSIQFKSMGHTNYLSALKHVDCIIGNSSSGILEAPSLRTPTINIGDRQKGRLKASSIIECKPIKKKILKSIKKIYSKKFRKKLINIKNPYESKNSSNNIFKIIKKSVIPFELKKKFYDL